MGAYICSTYVVLIDIGIKCCWCPEKRQKNTRQKVPTDIVVGDYIHMYSDFLLSETLHLDIAAEEPRFWLNYSASTKPFTLEGFMSSPEKIKAAEAFLRRLIILSMRESSAMASQTQLYYGPLGQICVVFKNRQHKLHGLKFVWEIGLGRS